MEEGLAEHFHTPTRDLARDVCVSVPKSGVVKYKSVADRADVCSPRVSRLRTYPLGMFLLFFPLPLPYFLPLSCSRTP